MLSYRKALPLLFGVCGVVVACDSAVRDPAGPGTAVSLAVLTQRGSFDGAGGAEEEVGIADASGVEPTGGGASGHVEVQGTPTQNVRDQKYSFNALSTGDLSQARGQVEVHYIRFTGEEIMVHAEVTCLSVVGDQAWVGSRRTRVVVDGQEVPEAVGLPMIFRVRDLGEGNDATDLASLVFFPPAGGDLAHCTTRPNFPILRQSAVGNVQVRPT